MEDEDLVVAVRLCDTVEEVEQPDPLCLRREDLITWRHFETLLLGMYKNPPAAIRVTYLDDDSDWVTIGSDIELAEAVRIIKETGDILQLQVKRIDTEELISFDSTESASSASAANTEAGQFTSYVPTTDPRGEVLKPLVYPHPPPDHLSNVDGPTTAMPQNDLPWLVYPQPSENSNLPMSQEITRDHQTWQQTTPFDFSGEAASSKDSRKLSTSSNLSSLWEEAASMTAEQKLKFMRGFIETNSQRAIPQAECKIQQGKDGAEKCLEKDTVSEIELKAVPPLCSEKGSLGMNFIPNQDPFEVNLDVQASFLEQVMINFNDDINPALAPKQAAASKSEASARYFRMSSLETDGAASVSFADTFQDKQISDLLVPTQASQSSTQTRAIYTSTVPKCKKVLKHAPAPIPMPRNLLIMEGAQSGANAVAIEMPSEFFSVTAVTKEEEIAASGGAATSASEETGEVMARGDSVAAAVSREIKGPSQNGAVCTAGGDEVNRHAGEKKAKRSSQKVKHSSSKRDRSSSEKKPEAGAGIGGAKPKLLEKSERKSNEYRKKQEDCPAKESSSRKDEKKVKVTEDVESGEKVNVKRETAALSRCDFAKYMKKTKKELHAAIVKDVTQVTEQYFNKVVEKTALSPSVQEAYRIQELAYHEGIYCDSCNKEITGIRYKCGNCIDFDLCSVCESKANFHDPTHVFLKLRSPARGAGTFGGKTYFLLVENIYEAEKRKQSVSSELSGSECSQKMAESHENSESAAVTRSEQEKEKPAVENQQTVDVAESGLPQDRDDLPTKEVGDCCADEVRYKHPEEMSHNFSAFLTSVEKLLPSAPVEPESEDTKRVQDSPTLSDSSSSIVPVSPPTVLSPTAPAYSTEVQQNASWDYFSRGFQPEDCRVAGFAGSEGDELPELLSENTVRHSERFAEDDGDSSSFEDMASDTSDDFCVIEAPASHRDEYEAIPGDICDEEDGHLDIAEADFETEAHHQDFPEAPAVVKETTLDDGTGLNLLDGIAAGETKCESEVEETNTEDGDNMQGGCDEKESEREEMRGGCLGAEGGVSVDGLVHTMNEEEKMRFAQLLKAEMDKEYEEEVKRRAQELEKEPGLQKEREFQIILEAKEKAAAVENEKLEWMTQKEEERASSISRQTSAGSFRSLDRSISDDGIIGSKKDADCQTIPEPVSPASHVIHNVASGVSKAAVSAFYTAKDVFYSLQAKQTEWKSTPSAYRAPQSEAKFMRNPSQQGTDPTEELRQSRSSQLLLPSTQEEVLTSQEPAQKKDSMENVQYPTSLAASHEPEVDGTSKPVKAVRPGGCWVPQMNNFRFSANNWSPPKDDYIPPTSTWTPPKREFIPPNIEWITTSKAGKVNNDAEKRRDSKGVEADDPLPNVEPLEASRRPSLMTSQKAPSLATLEIADTALRRELQGMQRLIEMGFANREKNRQLLNKFENDLEKVVQCLLQEEGEGEDSHWSFRRH